VACLTLIIDSTEQIHQLTGDQDESRRAIIYAVGGDAWCEATRLDRTETHDPTTNSFEADGDPTLSKQVLDISEAECEAQIQPNGVLMTGGTDNRVSSVLASADAYQLSGAWATEGRRT
jgi:hypothetical protein